MRWVLVLVLVWIAVAVAGGLLLGRVVHRADVLEHTVDPEPPDGTGSDARAVVPLPRRPSWSAGTDDVTRRGHGPPRAPSPPVPSEATDGGDGG